MSLQLFALLVAHATLAAAAIDYADRTPFAWPELLGATYLLGMGAAV